MVDELNEIMRALGRMEGRIQSLEDDIVDGKESRGRIHTKLEKIEEDVSIVRKAAQARDLANTVDVTITTDVKPATDDFKRMRAFGKTTLWAVGLAAAGLGSLQRPFGTPYSGGAGSVPHPLTSSPIERSIPPVIS